MSARLDKILREAREDLGTREAKQVDWDEVDDALFARVDEDRRADAARSQTGTSRTWVPVTVGLAAAAALAMVVGRTRDPRTLDGSQASAQQAAGNVVAVDTEGQLVVDGQPAATGTELRLGDVIETHAAQVTVERPGKLTMVLEHETRARVTHVEGALVLALESGAVEAQVVPVPNGEAFAVDVEGSRVAVHGTHLRVQRADTQVVVDLNEGVVSIGEAPRSGSTLGSLVTAAAHAEFAWADPQGSLVVSHDPASVRPAAAVGRLAMGGPPVIAPSPLPPQPEFTAQHSPVPAGALTRPQSTSTASPPAAPPLSPPDPNAEQTVAAAVRACMGEHPGGEGVTVTVGTTVTLDVGDNGVVHLAHFWPPIGKSAQDCSGDVIFKTRFDHGGSVSFRVDRKN
jgi:ferric-dicitrate binding protein FerR (iron transport regulator)